MSVQDQEQVKSKSIVDSPKIKLVGDPRALTIIEFVRSKDGVTMDKVAKYMDDEGICSRPTTRRLLFSLLQEGILKEKQRRNKYFHDLEIDDNYDFEGLLEEVFTFHAERFKELLKPFEDLIKGKKVLTSNPVVNKNPKHGLTELSLGVTVIDYEEPQKAQLTNRQEIEYENRVENKILKDQLKREGLDKAYRKYKRNLQKKP